MTKDIRTQTTIAVGARRSVPRWRWFCSWAVPHGLWVVLLLLALGSAVQPARAADAETRAFNTAAKALKDDFASLAEREFASFVEKFPDSPRVPDAILGQARAAFSRTNFVRALSLLQTNLLRAGSLADQYWFWLGQTRLASGDAAGAAADFAQLLRDYTNSTCRLEASYGEAQARFNLQEWPRVIELLQKPDGVFQQAARSSSDSEVVALGQLRLAEALTKLQNYRGAETVAQAAPTNSVKNAWTRQFLLCRIQLATAREETALGGTTNLLFLAAASGQPRLLAESLALQGAILEELQEYEAAIRTYEKIQGDAMPEELRRDAFLKIVELLLAQDELALATARLDKFLAAHPEDTASDEVLLTLGELRLKQHLTPGVTPDRPATNDLAGPLTNRLQQAIAYFEQLPQRYPQSPHVGKAHLDRGWALLADGKTLEAQAAFQLATNKLPFSEDQAIAHFKLADTQFLLGDYTNALAGYTNIIENYGGLPRIRTGLFDRAWYQIARVCMKTGDAAGANDAMRKIMVLYPASLYAERAPLLFGQELVLTKPAEARALFLEMARIFPRSELLPQVQMALARSHELENHWAEAVRIYDELLLQFATNQIAPRAEFNRALALDHAGDATNALRLLTNFLVRFPTNEFAPRAQDWIGDYYYRAEDFVEAEKNYQRLFQNTKWPVRELTFQARFKAGRAAAMRPTGYNDAIEYFTNLIDPRLSCPTNILADAFFAYGDLITLQPLAPEATNNLARFGVAIAAFEKIPQLCAKDPANAPLIARAWGRIADCYLQLATQNPSDYTNAYRFYSNAVVAAQADLATRCQAEIGIGHVLVKLAQLKSPPDPDLLKSALEDHYLSVVYGKNLRDDEAPVPFWVKEAGSAAARLLDSQKSWTELLNLYTRLQEILPSLRPSLEKKIATVRELAGGRRE